MASYLPFSLWTFTRAIAGIFVGGFIVTAGLLYRYQLALIYPSSFPTGSRTQVLTPAEFDLAYEDVRLETPDGVELRAYLMCQTESSEKEKKRGDEGDATSRRPTVLFLHANAGNMGHRLPIAAVFFRRFGCNVLMLSYRGYGLSAGTPSERGIRIDAQTALDYIRAHPLLKDTPVVAYGQSIGGAVAVDLAARNVKRKYEFDGLGSGAGGAAWDDVEAAPRFDSKPTPAVVVWNAICDDLSRLIRASLSRLVSRQDASVHALILENTFLSIPELIPHVLPPIKPLAFLCRETWPTGESIKRLARTTPCLFLSGRADELVPPSHMDALFTRCSSTKKIWKDFDEGTHNDTCVKAGYFEAIAGFLSTYVVPLTTGVSAASLPDANGVLPSMSPRAVEAALPSISSANAPPSIASVSAAGGVGVGGGSSSGSASGGSRTGSVPRVASPRLRRSASASSAESRGSREERRRSRAAAAAEQDDANTTGVSGRRREGSGSSSGSAAQAAALAGRSRKKDAEESDGWVEMNATDAES